MECKKLPPLASTTKRTASASDFEPINASCNLGSIVDVLLKAAIAELAAKELLGPEMATRTSALLAGAIIWWMLETIGESRLALPIRADAMAPEIPLLAAGTQTKLNFCCSNKIAADCAACCGDWLPDVAQPANVNNKIVNAAISFMVVPKYLLGDITVADSLSTCCVTFPVDTRSLNQPKRLFCKRDSTT